MDANDWHLTEVPTPYGPVQIVRHDRPCPRLSFSFPGGMPAEVVAMLRAKLTRLSEQAGGRVVEAND